MPRTEPPVIGDAQNMQDSTIPVRIGSVNVAADRPNEVVSGAQFNNTPIGQALQQGAVAVRVIEGFSSEAAKGVTMFGLTMFEGAAVLGEAPVFPDGSWLANVPPYIPMHLQPIDKYRPRDPQPAALDPGHAGRGSALRRLPRVAHGPGLPVFGQNPTVAEQHGPSEFTEAIADRTEYPWDKKVQPILDAKCVSCHNGVDDLVLLHDAHRPGDGRGDTYKIPTLDLSSTPVTVYYDRKVATYPASYVSIFYPATLGMMAATATPPEVAYRCAPSQGAHARRRCTPCGASPAAPAPRPSRRSSTCTASERYADGRPHGISATDAPRGPGRHAHRRRAQDDRRLPDGPRRPVLGSPEHGVRALHQRRPSPPRGSN